MPMKIFPIDLAGNNMQQFNQFVVNQTFLHKIGKGVNAHRIRENSIIDFLCETVQICTINPLKHFARVCVLHSDLHSFKAKTKL